MKACACERPGNYGLALARWSIRALVKVARGLSAGLAAISRSSVQRVLARDALKPWQFRSWLYPRDPHFIEKAGRVLDLYARIWDGKPLAHDEYVLSADEKTSIQARRRRHLTQPAKPGEPARVEAEYTRCGATQYLAALDVDTGRVFGRCEAKTGIVPFDRLVDQVMGVELYRSARRVFWIVDNGSSHRGLPAAQRLCKRYPNLVLVHLPVHASWLNQVEIYFSIVHRQILTPTDFPSVAALERQLLTFQSQYNCTARPFGWRYTRSMLLEHLRKLEPANNMAA
ncbi:MAG: IS630 family transposase [Firmicutes bacterium]|nr:IS630 family transposase [Bacillota bacterium]